MLNALFGLDGKTVLVTGAAHGIGFAVAELFAAAGASVTATDIDAPALSVLASAHPQIATFPLDIADEAAVVELVGSLAAGAGVDILVHAAGVFPKRDFLKMTAAQWDALHAVNTRGTFLMMRETVRAMRAAGRGGAIVNISSIGGERASTLHNSAYCASKAAVTNLTRTVALEVAAQGIRVNAVLPGGVATEGARKATAAMVADGLRVEGPATQPGRMPLGRIGTAEEIAQACLFLAGPAASYITGQALAVDGGFLIS